MTTNRRDFIKLVGTTTGGFLFLPKFLSAMPGTELFQQFQTGNNTLVIIQLNGGNDGLNTFIPYDNPLYYDYRKNIAIKKDDVLKSVNGMGFHPSMTGFEAIQQEGNLCVLQNVGYPNPNRSHFRSIEIWQTGSNANENLNTGWLGRYLDAQCAPDDALGALNIDNLDNLALRGTLPHNISIQDPIKFEQQIKSLSDNNADSSTVNQNLDFVRKLMVSSFEGSDQIKKVLEKTKNSVETYPKFGLAQNLRSIARMIKGGLPTSVYYTGQGGFDTHAGQVGKQKGLLNELSESVKAFYDDLKTSGLMNNVTVMVFSEFGRRVHDNGQGTDHGTAAPVFIIGGGVQSKIIGSNPDLSRLDSNGDLHYEIDFRSVYATILKNRLKFDPAKAGIKQEVLKGLFA